MIKVRSMAIVLLLLVLVAGCRPGGAKSDNLKPAQSGQPKSAQNVQQAITSADTFLSLYKQWSGTLANLAGEVNDAYGKWNKRQIGRQEFLDQLYGTQQKLETLEKDTDYQDFELNEAAQQKINSKAITREYLIAEKGVNDFLYYAPHLNDQQIQARYNSLMLEQYAGANKDLQTLFNQQQHGGGRVANAPRPLECSRLWVWPERMGSSNIVSGWLFWLAIVAIICYVMLDMLKSQETLKSSCALLFYRMDKKHLKDSRFCMN